MFNPNCPVPWKVSLQSLLYILEKKPTLFNHPRSIVNERVPNAKVMLPHHLAMNGCLHRSWGDTTDWGGGGNDQTPWFPHRPGLWGTGSFVWPIRLAKLVCAWDRNITGPGRSWIPIDPNLDFFSLTQYTEGTSWPCCPSLRGQIIDNSSNYWHKRLTFLAAFPTIN